ncbi:MAG: hypothetical protein OCC46_13055 [Pseudodesulfovibrio sp.]
MGLREQEVRAVLDICRDKDFSDGLTVTYGTQTVQCSYADLAVLFFEKGIMPEPVSKEDMALFTQDRSLECPIEGNIFLKMLGAGEILNLDVLPHSPMAYVHDLGQPIPDELKGKASFVFDGTTGYHVFDRCMSLCNAANLLRVGGTLIHTFTMNPHSTTFNSFNPQALVRFYECNGFGDFQLYMTDRGHCNSIYKSCGDPRHAAFVPDLTRYMYIFAATKEADVELRTDILEWQYELYRQVELEESISKELIAGKKVAIWGTGGNYVDNYASLVASAGSDFSLWGFVDGDSSKHGTTLDGYEIKGPDSLVEADIDVVIIASWAKEAIFAELSSLLYGKPHVLAETYKLYRGSFERRKTAQTLLMGKLSNSVYEPHVFADIATMIR